MDPCADNTVVDVKSVFLSALEIDTDAERQDYLNVACANNLQLRHQVEKLLTAHGGLVLFHLLLGIVLLTGAIVHERFGRFAQYLGAVLLAAAGAAAVFLPADALGVLVSDWLDAMLPIYSYAAMVVALTYGYCVSNGWYYGSAALILGARLSDAGWQSYNILRRTIEGLDYLFFGLLFFLVAMLISLSKAGLLRRTRQCPAEETSLADDQPGH